MRCFPAVLDVDSLFIAFRWYLVDRWGRRAILLSGAVVVGTLILDEFVCTNSSQMAIAFGRHWMVDVRRCSTDRQCSRNLRDHLQRGLWI